MTTAPPRPRLTIAVPIQSNIPAIEARMCCPPGRVYGFWAEPYKGIWLRATTQRTVVNHLSCAFGPDHVREVDFTGTFGDARADNFAKRLYGYSRHRRCWAPLTCQMLNSYEYTETNERCLRVFTQLGYLAKLDDEYHFTYGFLAMVVERAAGKPHQAA